MQNRKAKKPKGNPSPLAEVDRRMTGLAEKTGKVMQHDTLKHVALAIMDPETKEKMLDHLAVDSYEELKARVFKYLAHVKRITYEAPKTWSAHLISTSGGGAKHQEGNQRNPQDQYGHEGDWWGAWSPQETLSALMALQGKCNGKQEEREHAGSVVRQDT